MSDNISVPPHRMSHFLPRLLRLASRRRGAIAAVLLLMLLRTGFDLLKPWPMKVLMDHALQGHAPSPRLAAAIEALPGAATPQALVWWSVAAMAVLALLLWAATAASVLAGATLGQRLAYDLAAQLFSHLQRLSLRFHGRRATGDMVRRVTTDSACVTTLIRDVAIPLIAALVMLIAIFIILVRLNWPLAMISLAVVPPMALVLRHYARPMMDASYRQGEVDGHMYTVAERTLSAIPAVQAFHRHDLADRQYADAAVASLSAGMETTRMQMRFKLFIALTTALGTAAILWVGAAQVMSGRLTLGTLLVFLSYLASLYGPLETLAYTSSTAQSAAGGARRILEVLSTDPDVKEAAHPKRLLTARGELTFDSLTFGYDPGRPVLRDLSLGIPAGTSLALVGATGAGKSTLASLVSRLFDPWSGSVKLDGIDLRELSLEELRRHVALVLQEPFLFPATIAENIAYGRPGATVEQIEAAARAANAHEFIQRLEAGYDTVIGERGATLSGGQRQRLGIARALLKDAPVLVLDEPTSALDPSSEALVMEALKRLSAGRTSLIIAHRLSTVRHADRAAVLDGGRIAELGTHEQLIAAGGLYARMHHVYVQSSTPEGA